MFNHERKLVCDLLSASSRQQNVVPQHVICSHTGPDAALTEPIVLNESFTIYFEDDADKHLKLVDCALGMPETIGNELLLVEDSATNNLVFLEYMGPSLARTELLTPSVDSMISCLQDVLPEGATHELLGEFESVYASLLTKHSSKVTYLTYARFLLIKSVAYFFLGTNKSFVTGAWEHIASYNLASGSCQMICLGRDIAVEGWLEY